MKKIFYSIISAVVLLSIAACSNDDDELGGSLTMGGAPNATTKIYASLESSSDTRAALQDDGEGGFNVVWKEGDKITVVHEGDYTQASNLILTYTLTEGAGTTEGVFETDEPVDWSHLRGTVKAYYGQTTKNDNYTWPSLLYHNGIWDMSQIPMIASTTLRDGKAPSLEFKNTGGILRLNLKGLCGVSNVSVSTINKYLNGIIEEYQNGSAVVREGNNRIDLVVQGDPIKLNEDGVPICIPVPVGEYNDFRIQVRDDLGNYYVKTLKVGKSLDIKRSKITDVTLTLTLNKDSKNGTIGLLNGRKAIIIKRDGKAVAYELEDYSSANATVVNGHSYYNSETVNTVEVDGWRLPTREEAEALLAMDFVYNGSFTWEIAGGNTFSLNRYGCLNKGDYLNNGSSAYYWTREKSDGEYGYLKIYSAFESPEKPTNYGTSVAPGPEEIEICSMCVRRVYDFE